MASTLALLLGVGIFFYCAAAALGVESSPQVVKAVVVGGPNHAVLDVRQCMLFHSYNFETVEL
jgi:hypothetical protein